MYLINYGIHIRKIFENHMIYLESKKLCAMEEIIQMYEIIALKTYSDRITEISLIPNSRSEAMKHVRNTTQKRNI